MYLSNAFDERNTTDTFKIQAIVVVAWLHGSCFARPDWKGGVSSHEFCCELVMAQAGEAELVQYFVK